MDFEIGKRVYVIPKKEWGTIHHIFYLPSNEWDDPDIPEIGNIQIKYDDGEIAKCNNWQLSETEE